MNKQEALVNVSISAAHHREIVELAIEETNRDQIADSLLDAGNALDAAIKLAHSEGASLFEMWRATKHLPVIYILELTSGSLPGGP